MKIGIIGAMEEEVACLIQGDFQTLSVDTFANRKFYSGTLYGIDTVIVISRIGKVAAATTATLLINRFHVTQVIFTGVAGAVDPCINIGDVIIASDLVQHDMDASPFFPKYEIPLTGIMRVPVNVQLVEHIKHAVDVFLNQIEMKIDKQLLDSFLIASPKSHIGAIASGDQFMGDQKKIDLLKKDFPDLCGIEMEGAAVAMVCHEHDIPFVVIRVVSDKADHSATLDFGKFILEIASHYSVFIVQSIYLNLSRT